MKTTTSGLSAVKLIWHADKLLEADWLREVFGVTIDTELLDLDLTRFDDNSIHVVSSNFRALPSYESYFKECRARCSRIFLFHASDEYYSGGYELYRHFDGVIRNFHTRLVQGSGILTIPEGYSNGTLAESQVRPADARRYAWSFTGEIKASRIDMAAALDGLAPQLLTHTTSISDIGGKKLSKPEFDQILRDTVFSPCPMGNVILETWRLYESLELGCIPLVERRATLDYFSKLFGPHPIPTFRNWADARRYADSAFADKRRLVRTQMEIGDWWVAQKGKVRAEIRQMLDGPSQAPALMRYSTLVRNRVPVLHEPLRLVELLRHQSFPSLRRRLSRPGPPLKRIATESLRHLRSGRAR